MLGPILGAGDPADPAETEPDTVTVPAAELARLRRIELTLRGLLDAGAFDLERIVRDALDQTKDSRMERFTEETTVTAEAVVIRADGTTDTEEKK